MCPTAAWAACAAHSGFYPRSTPHTARKILFTFPPLARTLYGPACRHHGPAPLVTAMHRQDARASSATAHAAAGFVSGIRLGRAPIQNNNLSNKSNSVTWFGDISNFRNRVTSGGEPSSTAPGGLFRRVGACSSAFQACGQAWAEKKSNLALIHWLESFFQLVPNRVTAAARCQPHA